MEAEYELDFFATRRGERPALEFIRALDRRARGKIGRWLARLEEFGPNLSRPLADVVAGPIRELRVSLGHDEYRFLYFIEGRTIIVTSGFRKKTWSLDRGEIERAQQRRIEWLLHRGEVG